MSGPTDPDVGRPARSVQARAAVAVAVVAAAMGLLLFGPAGTVHYWQGWVYLSIFAVASALTTLYVIRHQPALLERRMRGGPLAETRPAQKLIMLVTSAGFVALLVVPALDHRFGWSTVPRVAVLAGDVLVITGFALIGLVYRENPWTAATIELAEDQRVVSTGPYAVVRHPMYASASLYLLGTPLALGSCWGFVPIATIIPFLIWRLLDEERFLAENLPGYADYRRRVRHRLVPFVW
jgi:protein-S-isoprenylcysteine O-methyltransferase Ste14